jgi:phosphoenolpyruvate carboxykinase (ATP)
MSTKQFFKRSEIRKGSPYFSSIRTTIETAAYGNNVYPVETVKEAYKIVKVI